MEGALQFRVSGSGSMLVVPSSDARLLEFPAIREFHAQAEAFEINAADRLAYTRAGKQAGEGCLLSIPLVDESGQPHSDVPLESATRWTVRVGKANALPALETTSMNRKSTSCRMSWNSDQSEV